MEGPASRIPLKKISGRWFPSFLHRDLSMLQPPSLPRGGCNCSEPVEGDILPSEIADVGMSCLGFLPVRKGGRPRVAVLEAGFPVWVSLILLT